MTLVERLARFAARASYDDLSGAAREQLKIRVLDNLACAIGALNGEPVRLVRAHVEEFDDSGPCTLIGGGHAPPDRAAFYNSALVRYLDFNDAYLAKGETCHPSDNLGAVLAAAEYARASGRDFLAALALAYHVQCRLSDVAPVRDAGFDHVTQGAYAIAAGVARALGLDPTRTAHAIAIAGTAFNALRVTRTGTLSHWKGLAYPNVAGAATRTTFLAGRGVTGPLEVFEGEKGFMDAVAGYFELNWETEDLERVTQTILKKYNAEIHSQSALEAVLELRHASTSRRPRSSAWSSTSSTSPTASSAAARRGQDGGPHEGRRGSQPPLSGGRSPLGRRRHAGAVPARAHAQCRCAGFAAAGDGAAG